MCVRGSYNTHNTHCELKAEVFSDEAGCYLHVLSVVLPTCIIRSALMSLLNYTIIICMCIVQV
jgi:hypothetical protein